MKVSPQVVIGILQVVWPLVSDDLKELAKKTETKWDDRVLVVIDWALGNVKLEDITDKESFVQELLKIIIDLKPEIASKVDGIITEGVAWNTIS
jgi:hypothetical protein